MKYLILAATVAFAGLGLATGAEARGTVEKACLRSERSASAALCNCIQQVADMTLSRSDQRRAAGFFQNPDDAQQVRASKKSSDNEFWARYRNFGAAAESYCAR